MAGAGTAIFTERDRDSALGQITDAWGVHPYETLVIRVHMDCGKVRFLTASGGEHEGLYDPADPGQLYSLADAAVRVALEALHVQYGDEVKDVRGVAEVVDIKWTKRFLRKPKPSGVLVPRPDYCRPLSNRFYQRYGNQLRPVAA
ncbi:MAG: hypothetical protein K0S68_503 [Candidatus Saccharibacteria bacterium]|jgi:hypothetical protein|nr:hypothetical protein [Candidatus Saccharibacteria bacterium]